jgi:hypothetical protein
MTASTEFSASLVCSFRRIGRNCQNRQSNPSSREAPQNDKWQAIWKSREGEKLQSVSFDSIDLLTAGKNYSRGREGGALPCPMGQARHACLLRGAPRPFLVSLRLTGITDQTNANKQTTNSCHGKSFAGATSSSWSQERIGVEAVRTTASNRGCLSFSQTLTSPRGGLTYLAGSDFDIPRVEEQLMNLSKHSVRAMVSFICTDRRDG